jgi:chromosome segregation ATPase
LKEQEVKIVEKSTSNLNIIKDQIKDLENQQGVSAQKIQELDSGAQGLLEKLLGTEKKFGEGLSQLETSDKGIIESITLLSTSTNEDLAKLRKDIDDNKKLTSEKLTESENILVSRFGDVDKEIKGLHEANTRHSQIMHSVEMLEDKLNNLDERQPKLKSDLQKLEVNVIANTEKIFALEEMNVMQVEKAQYVETLSAKVNQIDEMRQQSEAKSQEHLKTRNEVISKELDDLKAKFSSSVKSIELLTPRVDSLETEMKNNMEEVSHKIKSTSEETSNVLKMMREEHKSSIVSTEEKIHIVKSNVQSIQSDIESSFNDQDAKLQKMLYVTEDHSNLFTSITSSINNMETKMSSYDSKQKAVTENILITSEAQLNEFRNKFDSRITEIMRRIDEHSDQFDQNELSIVDLKKVVGENYLHTQRDVEELRKRLGNEQESVVMRISEQRETIESLFNSLQEKIERHEKTQIRESSRMKYVEKKSESNERHILQLDRKVTEVEKLGEDTSALWKQLGELQEYANNSRADLQSIRGYTVVLKSEGIVKKHQADVLGVYRMVDSYNDRPVDKQDGGENYIYYSSASNTWFVGTVVGHQYGWLRNSTESASSRRWIPDLKSGWEYRPLVRTMDHLDSNSWHSDDGSLRIEYLRDVEKVNELFRDIKDIQKAD